MKILIRQGNDTLHVGVATDRQDKTLDDANPQFVLRNSMLLVYGISGSAEASHKYTT